MARNSFLGLGPHGFHRIAYTEWGSPDNRHKVVCVHGLTRNSRDFDYLAMALERDCHVVCVDMAGRGDSDWLEHKEDYGFALYLSDAAALLARLSQPQRDLGLGARLSRLWRQAGEIKLDWVGTSMGGLIGMMLAAQPKSPIRRLVLNDVGPLIPWAGLMRLKSYADYGDRFSSLAEVEAHLRKVCATWGPLTEGQWQHLARHSSRRLDDGTYRLAFDPAILHPLRQRVNSDLPFGSDFLLGIDLWPVWDQVRCPTLVLRGAESDILTAETAVRMQARGLGVRLIEFPGIGHAPALMSADQIQAVGDFLLASG